MARARIAARREGRLAGIDVALAAFTTLDPTVTAEFGHHDGEDVAAGATLAVISGSARVLLSGERTALNLLGRMSGIATTTRDLTVAVGDHKARIVCTRKTAPGLRLLDKYSVRAGGGVNHRFGLGDGVLIKDNHRVMAGGVAPAIERVRQRLGHMVKVEVEVDTLAELEEALRLDVDAVLLDNMAPEMLAEAVALVGGRVVTEASGGITPQTVAEVAAAGVDLISLGWLTHSVTNWDVGLDFEPQ
jgi:nicotinate-nucleotide pyrophosphorylase (carboxylating)